MDKVVIHQPHPDPRVDVPNSHEWGSGICNFTEDMRSCCLGFWCCPCFACMISKEYGECLCLPLLEFFRAWLSPVTMSMRTSVRERYNIEGSIAKDCVCATFCTPLRLVSNIQRATEKEDRRRLGQRKKPYELILTVGASVFKR